MTEQLRALLHKQVDEAPEPILNQMSRFLSELLHKTPNEGGASAWSNTNWQEFALQQFFRDLEDEPIYTLEDAQEVYD